MTLPTNEEEQALLTAARAWIDDDPDASTRAELSTLLEVSTGTGSDRDAALADLAERFSGLLQFGTAGLRGAIGAGPNRMNRAVVIRAAAGLVAYLKDALAQRVRDGELSLDAEGKRPPRIVVGYDARHRSKDFAIDTAAVAVAAGCEVLMFAETLPTPLLAFAIRELNADAGVMVTASHNPPQDNGYKVYLGGRVITDAGQGTQIVPPMDTQIAARIGAIDSSLAIARAEQGWKEIPSTLVDEYVRVAAGEPVDGATPLRIVRTALHGVGGHSVERVLEAAGFTDIRPVPEQEQPDPDFPTVAFPNPEEPGAIDRALDLARKVHADLVLANDPDADRCAAAIKDPLAPPETGGWRMLHGDEVGSLLGDYIAASHSEGVLANSIVSSRLLAKIASSYGLEHRATLTGFKWISRVPGLVYGYEEALGYCVDPERVRDKDGMSAATLIAKLATELKESGSSLAQRLDDLARTHGLHLTDQLAARFTDQDKIVAAVNGLRANPPTSLAGSPVTSVVDLANGTDELPPTDALVLTTEDATRVIVRPSGTEPKLKCYIEVIHPVGDATSVARVRIAAREHLETIKSELTAALGL